MSLLCTRSQLDEDVRRLLASKIMLGCISYHRGVTKIKLIKEATQVYTTE